MPSDVAHSLKWRIEPFIDGQYLRSESDDLVANINPARESLLCSFPVGSAADVDAAVTVARRRFEEGAWCGLGAEKRVEILLRLGELIAVNKAEIALLDTLEMGKPITAALYDAERFSPTVLRECAGFADKLYGESVPLSSRGLTFNTYEPRGVVGAITAWNFPIVNAVIKIAPALAAGNSVVLKPSEITPSSALRLGELAIEAGVPPGVLNIVPGLGATVGAAIGLHPDIDFISFTGSTATGRRLLQLSGQSNGKPLLLECGGKSPQIVFDDIEDLDAVAQATVQSAFANQGQVCLARTRLLVHRDVKRALLERIVTRTAAYVPKDPLLETTSFGPLASPAQRDRVRTFVERGHEEGAHALVRGKISNSDGCYVAPTVFDEVKSTMAIVQQEIFGPVLCIQSFTTEDEAITLANQTEYGLAATAWTRDLGRAKRLGRRIRAGSISIRSNGQEETQSPFMLGHEPQKASGFGAEFGRKGLESYSTLKAVSFVGE